MKRRIFLCLLALCLFVNITATAEATSARIASIGLSISFEDEIATCCVDVAGDNIKDSIFAIVKLYDEDGTCVKTWVQSGSGFMNFSRTISVTSGVTYTLRAYVTINDVSQPTVSTTRTCP